MARLMSAPERSLDERARLQSVQAQLKAEAGPLRSLDPARARASTLLEVHTAALALVDPSLAEVITEALAEGLAELALAQLDAFPGNLFWDLDLIAAAIVAEAAALAPEPARACVADRFARMAALQHLYGRRTPINFSYVHDFVYGFDWAKWLAREPSLHADPPGPFSLAFLEYMHRRGHELLGLIAADDDKYPSLDGDEPRNPFPFPRDREPEIRLHRELARRDLIPVPTWERDVSCRDWSSRWRIGFARQRIAVATELGLVQPR
ncbi:MAG: ferrochelatase [Enhygromyxa sp.]